MSKIRINDLARELEVKSKAILDSLPHVGVTEKKTHSSSLEDHEADKVRAYLRGTGESPTSRTSRTPQPASDGIKTKIDLSHISKPGDVLKAIIGKQQTAAAPVSPSRPAPPPAETKPAQALTRPAAPAPPSTSSVAPPPPRTIVPPAPKPVAPPPMPASTVAPPPAPPAQAPAAPVAQASAPQASAPQVIAPKPPVALRWCLPWICPRRARAIAMRTPV